MEVIKIGNSFIFGVQHYNMGDVKKVLNYVKHNFKPDDKIVFMGEGGDDNNRYAEGSEQEAIKNDLETYFTNFINDSWDGADLNVMNSRSILFKEMQSESGLSANKIMAAIYVIIVGQTAYPQEMVHLLNNEGIEWIKSFGVKNPKEPDEEDIELMYNLCFPQDTGKPETELSKLSDIFNHIRDKNLVKKIKNYRKQGYRVIATAGEGHIDLIKNNFMNQQKSMDEKWSKKYKDSIDCDNPKGFSQRAHCQGKKKRQANETDASSSGSFEGPLFGGTKQSVVKRKISTIPNFTNESKTEIDEQGIQSSGQFDVPAFGKTTKGGRKNPLAIDGPDSIYKSRAVKDKKWPRFGGPGGVYVKVKEKCKKFPYCNQGNTGALEFIREDEELKNAISETSIKYGIPYSEVEKLVLNEISKIFI